MTAAFNAVLLVYAWIHFAEARPEYFQTEWPTFSRALTVRALIFPWLAAIAGAGLFAGSLAIAALHWDRAKRTARARGLLFAHVLFGLACAPLGIVHFFHVTITLSIDNDMHMALSYTFFFGMTGLVAIDRVLLALERRAGHTIAPVEPKRLRTHARLGFAALGTAVLFLVTFILKDVAWNPWQGPTQKLFVVCEATWIVLVHVYGLYYALLIRAHFAAQSRERTAPDRVYARSALVLALAALGSAWAPRDAAAQAPAPAAPAAIGGTGRIQPAGGVIVIAAPPGRGVDQVLVREGDRVKKGQLLLTLADQSTRTLERDLAAERLRNAERQAVERRRAAELELQNARLANAQAAADVASIRDLDERTFPAREKRTRENTLAQSKVSLEAAGVKLDEARKSAEAELRMARTQLKLAEAALAATRVVAPVDATVLEVHVQPGSSAGGPAFTLADTSRMYVVADFFEGDLPKLAAGQRATVANNALGQTLSGAVERIGRIIDPVNRLVKVWVRLDKPAPADRFIGMQVDVKVDPGAPRSRTSS